MISRVFLDCSFAIENSGKCTYLQKFVKSRCRLGYSAEIRVLYCKFQKIREMTAGHLYQGLDQSTKGFLMFKTGHTSIDWIGKKKVFSSFGYMRFRSNRKWENLGLCFTDCPIFEVKNCSESSSSCDLACARFGCSSFQSF